ncbi:hypothetical protein ACFQV2_06250 [Actinokineospora soli]|uniref:TIGR04222 domain-containing protein n=1 Tax=Actinokineospora soli TaxID=1048753 RepID=A0ABW2TIP0_9PSEU
MGRQMIDTLADHGYLTSYHRARRLRRVHWLFLALLAVCALRTSASIEADAPHDTIFEAVTATLVAWFVFRLVLGRARSRITAPGREALRQARAHTPPLATHDVLAPVALYGVSAYPNPDLAQVMTLTRPTTTTSGSGCGSGCGTGSSDGSGSDSGGSDGGSSCGGGCGGGGGD